MFVACCVLVIDCCMLCVVFVGCFVVCCLGCCMLDIKLAYVVFGVCCLLLVLGVGGCSLFVVRCSWFVVRCSHVVVRGLMSLCVVCCFFLVRCLLWVVC